LAKNEALFLISLLVNVLVILFFNKKNSYFQVLKAIWVAELVYWIMLAKHYVHGYCKYIKKNIV
jgi:hypothetical protein